MQANLPPLLEPFPMSQVTLGGEFAEAQRRNQEVLLSLNMSSFACHFTTTANLTLCLAPAATWHSYQKTSTGYVHKAGFLSAGDDVQPPATVPSLDQCEKVCTLDALCVGITFEDVAHEFCHLRWRVCALAIKPHRQSVYIL